MSNCMEIKKGWLNTARQQVSPHFSARQDNDEISLLVIHNISLPAGQFGGPFITDLFLGRLDPDIDPSFIDIYQLRVSAHCLIRRDGEIIQYVSFNDKAWHAGVSCFNGRESCNDFSIGIELEGTDNIPYTIKQYQQLVKLTALLIKKHPLIAGNIAGHCDIAPSRKTDPGDSFDWLFFRNALKRTSTYLYEQLSLGKSDTKSDK